MKEREPQEVHLTSEQRRRLGHVYRLILSWRRERKNKAEKPIPHETAPSKAQLIKPISDPVGRIESEA